MADIVASLKQVLGAGAVLEREAVAERATSYWDQSPTRAKALVRPANTQEISAILALCHEYRQSVVTHGGRTTCVQGTQSRPDDIILSTERMNAIEEIDPIAGTAIIQAGAILETVQQAVQDKGLFLPLDLGARGSCTLGGNLATNAGGVNVLRYGMARSMVLGLETVLADGTIISSMNTMLKNNAGYDLKQLFIGTEGTLGVISRMVVRLMPLSTTTNTALVALADFAAVPDLLNHFRSQIGTTLSAFEVMWGDYVRAVTVPGAHRAPMDTGHEFYVLLECHGSDAGRDQERFMEVIEAAFENGLIVDAVLPKSESERQALWAIRDDFDAILRPKPVYLYDVSLPITKMQAYVAQVQEQLRASLSNAVLYALGHIGDGNLHFFVQAHTQDANARALADQAIYEPLQVVGGSVSAEHGIGFEKKTWLCQSRSAAEIALMQTLKKTLDPRNILNPGLVFDMGQ
ncbi:MAG: FAD-binding oxidoreductase [Robiginitomaculum sp.]|nr:FAD-binding oxidoreductase [Robiginitomaculum sp.]MDQ7078648.1 FAD-binding oxidoreductase [Robiginitomaculum sp.]